jgi:hypothetical protein
MLSPPTTSSVVRIRDRVVDVTDVLSELDRSSVPAGGAGDAKVPAVHARIPELEPTDALGDRDVVSTQGDRGGLVLRDLAAPVREGDAQVIARVRRRQIEIWQGDLGVRELGEPRGIGAQRVVGLVVQPVAHCEVRDHGGQDDGDRHREHTQQREADAEAHCSRNT